MAYEFKFPDIGEGLTEGEIVRWKVKEGDEIKEGQPLVEVETDKALAEIPSPKTGKAPFFGLAGTVEIAFVRRQASQAVLGHGQHPRGALRRADRFRALEVRSRGQGIPFIPLGETEMRLDHTCLLRHPQVLVKRLGVPIVPQRIRIAVLTPGEPSGAEFGFGADGRIQR